MPVSTGMNNLHRELAPITAQAWAEIEDEARRTFQRNVGGRRVVDVTGPDDPALAAVGTGHLTAIEAPAAGVSARLRQVQPWSNSASPSRSPAKRWTTSSAERRTPTGSPSRTLRAPWRSLRTGPSSRGTRQRVSAGCASAPPTWSSACSTEVREYPDTVSRALTTLRLAGVAGPYSLLLGADTYTEVSETSDHGYPIAAHLGRLLDAPPIWAPALNGAFLVSTRGGDFELRLSEDLSIGYSAHDTNEIELYFRQTLTFLVHTDEAVVALTS